MATAELIADLLYGRETCVPAAPFAVDRPSLRPFIVSDV
jgi:glycine/D-amino acid oxidase-like deaminating enzyme